MSAEKSKFARTNGLLVQLLTYLVALGIAAGVVQVYTPGNLMLQLLAADVAATFGVWVLARLFRNSSLYDPYWSLAPIVLAAYILSQELHTVQLVRAALTFGLVNMWGWRLTWNFLRGWPGLHHQDWRYDDLQRQSGRWYPLVELGGIMLFPTLLVYLGCLPLFYSLREATALNGWDLLGGVVTLLAVVVEGAADNQLRRFRQNRTSAGQVLTSGLWAYSRHPNYLGEIGFWWGLYFLGLAASLQAWWTVLGPLSITLLFVFISIPMIDKRHLARRGDAYRQVMARIPAVFPRIRSARKG